MLFVVEAGRFGADDAEVLALLPTGKPVLLIANKLDAVHAPQPTSRPGCSRCRQRHAFAEFVPMSATKAADAERLLGIVEPYLPEQPWLYDAGRAHRPQRPLPRRRDRPREAVPPDRRRAAVHLDGRDRQVRGRGQRCAASPRPSSSSATPTRA